MDRKSLHAETVERVLASNTSGAQNALYASWSRSRNHHRLDPEDAKPPERLTTVQLGEIRQRYGLFLDTAKSTLDELFLAVGNSGCCVLVADDQGVPFDRRGAAVDDTQFDDWGLWLGTLWNEAQEGTNGIGTCIAETRAVTIHKDQHFRSKNTALSCMGAPIFDERGKLLAVIDVSSCRSDLTPEYSRLIAMATIEAAKKIETSYFRRSFPDAQIMYAGQPDDTTGLLVNQSGPGLLAVNRDGFIVGATRRARKKHRIKDADIKAVLPLAKIYAKQLDMARELSRAEYRIIQQVLALTGGNVSKAARLLGLSRSTLHRKINQFENKNSSPS